MSKAKGNKNQDTGDEDNENKVLQAVIIADDCGEALIHFDESKPICLQEVAGAPILDYILKALNCPRISEIIVLTEKHGKRLEEHLAGYKKSGKKINLIQSERCHSYGDCMRELSALRILKERFLIIKSGCVFNINITDVIERFDTLLKKKDSNVIQLKVFGKASPLSELRTVGENPYLLLDKENTILYYDNIESSKFKIEGSHSPDLESFKVNFKHINNFVVRNDLFDTMISVCHANVLNYYNENFDYHNEREYFKDLLFSEISSECVSVYELNERQYALDIKSPSHLLQANLDGLRCYIDGMINFDANVSYKYKERFLHSNELHSYFSKDAKLDFTCRLGNNTLIHENVEIGAETRLTNTVVLKDAKVASRGNLNRVLLGLESSVGQNCFLKNVCVGSSAQVGANCRLVNVTVESNAAIADGEKLENITVKADGSRVSTINKTEANKALLEDDFEFEFGQEEEIIVEEAPVFDAEVRATLIDATDKNTPSADVIREIKNLKLAQNKTLDDCRKAICTAILSQMSRQIAQSDKKQLPFIMESNITTWKDLLAEFASNQDDQLVMIDSVLNYCEIEPLLKFLPLLQTMYKQDVFDGRSIIAWHERLQGREQTSGSLTDYAKTTLTQSQQFIDWLRKSEDSGSEEGKSSDSGESEESESHSSSSEKED